jgi:hypothetical protein
MDSENPNLTSDSPQTPFFYAGAGPVRRWALQPLSSVQEHEEMAYRTHRNERFTFSKKLSLVVFT